MPAIITSGMRIFAAEQFIASFSDSATNMYVFIGTPCAWPDDNTPPLPVDSVGILSDCYHDMMALKKVASTDVSLAVPLNTWTTGNVYTQYTDKADLFNPPLGTPPFYVITTNMNVYKCMFNNGGVASTVAPTGTALLPFTTNDGYTWKFMFTVSSSDAVNFMTNLWMPVKTLTSDDGSNQWTVQQAATPGAIDRVDIITGGTQYSSSPYVTITGDGVGATAIVDPSTGLSNGNVIKITVTAGGSGYTWANVAITSDSGNGGIGANGATAVAVLSPLTGHGADPVAELGGRYVIISTKLIYDENGAFTVGNDFRRIGIVANPLLFGTTTPATALDYCQAWSFTFSSVTGGAFTPDEQVVGLTSGATGYVMDFDSTSNILRLVTTAGTFLAGEQIQNAATTVTGTLQTIAGTVQNATTNTIQFASGSSTDGAYTNQTVQITAGPGSGQTRLITGYTGSTRTATINTAWSVTPTSSSSFVVADIVTPAIQPFSGSILYVENRRPISRSIDQSEGLKTIMEF